ncbi:unnamed protein product [Prunus brigantina]
MHIEKNVFENVIGTMMSIDGKTKYSLNAPLDLQEMGIRKRYHPEEGDDGKLYFIPEIYLDVSEPLIELSYFLNQIVISLCKLEKIFPPVFFDIMIHLACHLAWEAKVADLVQFRWMYPVEKYLHKLKTYVHNKAHLEGSIAEAFGKCVLREMSIEFHKAATHYVLQNCDEAFPFVQEHKNILIQSSVGKVEESHRLQFSNWISKRVTKLYNDGKVIKQMLSLARGPER